MNAISSASGAEAGGAERVVVVIGVKVDGSAMVLEGVAAEVVVPNR